MTNLELQHSLKALAEKERLMEWVASGAKVSRMPSIIEAFGSKHFSPEKCEQIATAAKLWYEPSAVQQRTADYVHRIYQKEEATPMPEIRAQVREAGHGFARMFGKQFFELPEFQQRAIKSMAMLHLDYIPTDAQGMNAKKGTYIGGPSQVGKTSVFAYLKTLDGFNYRIVTAYQLASFAQKYGEQSLVEEYSKGRYLCIDEVGWEEAAKVYGQSIDIVPLIIHARYGRGHITHFTSNFRLEDLRYEEHIKMRILQSCNVIETGNEKPFLI